MSLHFTVHSQTQEDNFYHNQVQNVNNVQNCTKIVQKLYKNRGCLFDPAPALFLLLNY